MAIAQLSSVKENPKKRVTLSIMCLCLFGLAACGQKGDLYLPEPQQNLPELQQTQYENDMTGEKVKQKSNNKAGS